MKTIILMLGILAGVALLAGGSVRAAEKVVNVENTVCPVSGAKINPASGMEPATFEYKGKRYNLCCGGCIGRFKADPEKYSKIAAQEVEASQKAMKDMPMGR